MRVSLFYNWSAGEGVPLDEIRGAIERHGHDLVCMVDKEGDANRLFDEFTEIVVAAGGDGTVGLAARMLAYRGIPLAILPIGTANNIATSVGIRGSIGDLADAKIDYFEYGRFIVTSCREVEKESWRCPCLLQRRPKRRRSRARV